MAHQHRLPARSSAGADHSGTGLRGAGRVGKDPAQQRAGSAPRRVRWPHHRPERSGPRILFAVTAYSGDDWIFPMKMPNFDYACPTSLEEAIELLNANEGAKVLSGGQSLFP